MDDYLKEALEIVRAQAKVRIIGEEEIISMVQKIVAGLRDISLSEFPVAAEENQPMPDAAKKSIKDQSISCLECAKSFKVLTQKHLSTHGLDADAYREKWGIKKNTPLVCKALQRERRKKMKEMRLWERRRKTV